MASAGARAAVDSDAYLLEAALVLAAQCRGNPKNSRKAAAEATLGGERCGDLICWEHVTAPGGAEGARDCASCGGARAHLFGGACRGAIANTIGGAHRGCQWKKGGCRNGYHPTAGAVKAELGAWWRERRSAAGLPALPVGQDGWGLSSDDREEPARSFARSARRPASQRSAESSSSFDYPAPAAAAAAAPAAAATIPAWMADLPPAMQKQMLAIEAAKAKGDSGDIKKLACAAADFAASGSDAAAAAWGDVLHSCHKTDSEMAVLQEFYAPFSEAVCTHVEANAGLVRGRAATDLRYLAQDLPDAADDAKDAALAARMRAAGERLARAL